MKKLVCYVLVLCICLGLFAGCGENSTSVAGTTSTSENSTSPISETMEENTVTELNYFDCSASALVDAINETEEIKEESPLSFDYDGMKVYILGQMNGGTRKLIYADATTDKIKAVLFKVPSSQGAIDLISLQVVRAFELLVNITDKEKIVEVLEATNNDEVYTIQSLSTQYVIKDEETILVFLPKGSDLNMNELNWKITFPDNYFFADSERRNKFKEYIEKFQFDKALDFVNAFIESNNPPKTDLAYQIQNILSNPDLSKGLTNCVFDYDDVEQKQNIFYSGLKQINKQNNIIAYIDEDVLSFKVGFQASKWLFFEDIIINTGEGENIEDHIDYLDVKREVLNSGILEYGEPYISDEDVKRIYSADSATLRFVGKNDKKYDHIITDKEKDCIYTMSLLESTHISLSNMVFHWENY